MLGLSALLSQFNKRHDSLKTNSCRLIREKGLFFLMHVCELWVVEFHTHICVAVNQPLKLTSTQIDFEVLNYRYGALFAEVIVDMKMKLYL